jgi:hypothetical protein
MTWNELKDKHAGPAGLTVTILRRADRQSRREYANMRSGMAVGRLVMSIRVTRGGKNLYTGTIRGDVDAFLNTRVPENVRRLV